MTETNKPAFYAGPVRTVTRIGSYYYGYAKVNDTSYFICIQKVGDINWLMKDEEFFTSEAAVRQIKQIEKEHYDVIKFEQTRR